MKNKPRVVIIFKANQFKADVSIYTPLFEGETAEDVKRKFDEALGDLPRKYGDISYNAVHELDVNFLDEIKGLRILSTNDEPGKESISITLGLEIQKPLYLPRDPETGAFVDLHLQKRCLKALTS